MRGVYFLANDGIIDLAIAFLNSLRLYNKSIPLCFIPFNSEVAQILRLASEYDFTVFPHEALLRKCDDLSAKFYGHPSGQYRKLAVWEGSFEEFIYIDVDTIVLQNIEFCFEFLATYDFITSHSNIETIRKWVWKESIFDTQQLTREQIDYAANTGFIVSRRGALDFDIVAAKLPNALALAPHMELFCAEQALLNYLIVTSGRPYSSLLAIARQNRRIDIPLERWAGKWFGYTREGKVILPPTHPPVLLVHWAGEWQRGSHKSSELWKYYRTLR